MSILDNSFTCANGHTFTANAKIRARCPTCGDLARFDFKKVSAKVVDPADPPKEPTAVLLRAGRPRVMPKKTVAKKAPAKKSLKVPKKKIVAAPVKNRKPNPKVVGKVAATGKAAAGIVKVRRVTGKIQPRITRAPKRTAIARHIEGPKSYLDSMMERFGG